MKIQEHKLKWFQENGFPVEEMESALAAFNEDAMDKNAPRKEVVIMAKKEVEEKLEPVEKMDAPKEDDQEEEVEKEVIEVETTDQPESVEKEAPSRDEVADTLVDIVKGLEESLAIEIQRAIAPLLARVEELEAQDITKLEKQKESIPQASLSSIFTQRLLRETGDKSVGNLSKDDPLLDRKPQETAPVINGPTRIPFLDSQIRGGN